MGAGIDGGQGNDMFHVPTGQELRQEVIDMQEQIRSRGAKTPATVVSETEQQLQASVPEIGTPSWNTVGSWNR